MPFTTANIFCESFRCKPRPLYRMPGLFRPTRPPGNSHGAGHNRKIFLNQKSKHMKNKLNVYIVSGANDGKTFFPVAEVRAKNKQQADLEFRTSRDLSFYSLRISFKIPMAQAYGLKHYRIDRKK